MMHVYPPPPPPYRYPPLTTPQLCRKRPGDPLLEGDQPSQRRRISQSHFSEPSSGDEDIAMFEAGAPDIVMFDDEASENLDYVLAHIPGQAPGPVRLGGQVPGGAPLAMIPTLLNG